MKFRSDLESIAEYAPQGRVGEPNVFRDLPRWEGVEVGKDLLKGPWLSCSNRTLPIQGSLD
jgi:hypothetical protein